MSRALEVIGRVAGPLAQTRAERRIKRMGTDELVDWAEAANAGVGKALNDWARKPPVEGVDSLSEARLGAASMLLVLEELELRRGRGF